MNNIGQLGDGTTTQRLSPTQVGIATTWSTPSVGNAHSCSTRTDNSLWCWGTNMYGQMGTGDYTSTFVPVRIGVGQWSSLAVGKRHGCGVAGAKLFCWGQNALIETFGLAADYGMLGNGDNRDVTSFTQVGSLTTWTGVYVGTEIACASMTGGTIWCWGRNNWGQLGTSDKVPRSSPNAFGGAGAGRTAGAA